MTKYSVGENFGDCPTCGQGHVLYEGGTAAACNSCGATFDVGFEEGEEGEQQTPQDVEVPAPEPPPVPEQPTVPVPEVQVEAPVTEVTIPAEEQDVAFTENLVADTPDTTAYVGEVAPEPEPPKVVVDDGIGKLKSKVDPAKHVPKYIANSRPFRWAHQMRKTGNPYRDGCGAWRVFELFDVEGGLTLQEALNKVDVVGLGDGVKYLLTYYEVLSQCIAAGLLVMNADTRKVTVCKGQPVVAGVP